jgi:hypothetical protein
VLVRVGVSVLDGVNVLLGTRVFVTVAVKVPVGEAVLPGVVVGVGVGVTVGIQAERKTSRVTISIFFMGSLSTTLHEFALILFRTFSGPSPDSEVSRLRTPRASYFLSENSGGVRILSVCGSAAHTQNAVLL